MEDIRLILINSLLSKLICLLFRPFRIPFLSKHQLRSVFCTIVVCVFCLDKRREGKILSHDPSVRNPLQKLSSLGTEHLRLNGKIFVAKSTSSWGRGEIGLFMLLYITGLFGLTYKYGIPRLIHIWVTSLIVN